MPRFLLYAIWFSMVAAVVCGTHYYLWARLVRDTQLTGTWRLASTWGIALLGISLPATMAASRLVKPQWSAPVVWTGFIWMGMVFFLLVLVFSGDVVRWSILAYHRFTDGSMDPSRRLFFSRAVGGSAAASAALLAGVSVRSAVAGAQVQKVTVKLKRLPQSMSGTRIAQISDLHVGPTIGREVVESLVQQVNRLKPDLIVVTGDLVDGGVSELRDAVAPLANLQSRFGTFFVTGNHEYYSGADDWIAELDRLGIKTLRNERVSIGTAEASFDLAGVDDAQAHRLEPEHGCDVERACAGGPQERELILLAHQPKAIHEAAKHGVGLQLSGHTHGGQIWPFGLLVALTQPYLVGLHQHNEHTQIYVNRGTGYWGPPMRLGGASELTVLNLVRV